jgi:valyl-tRNA synthetase
VTREFGTGALKVTPAHDLNDFELGVRHNLPLVNMMEPDGKVSAAGGPYAGLDRFEARKKILEDLEARGLLDGKEKHVHNVPRCQRCDTIVEYYLSKQWFVKMKPLAEPAIRVVKDGTVTFTPERWSNTYLHWMENIRDWCISRQLWWGHRIPVWYCTVCGKEHCARGTPVACSKCGATALEQDPDVLDTWFSSWLWPFATMDWPEKTPALKKFYPGSVLVTGHEIIFFWVARMIMAGLEFMGDIPFSDVSIHGIIRDEQGRKMSKSLGNGIDPLEVVDETSADALRFTIFYLTPEGQDARLSKAKFVIGRNFCTKLWNAGRLILGSIEGWTWTDDAPDRSRAEDRWLLSRLHHTIDRVNRAFDGYEYNGAASALYDFVWAELCDWWLEIAKPRFAANDPTAKHVAAYALDRVLRLLHPIAPFITEELWLKLRERVGATPWAPSIMVAPYPAPDAGFLDATIEGRFEVLTSVVREIRGVRQKYNLKEVAVRATVTGGPGSLALLEQSRDMVVGLGRLESLEIQAAAAKPKAASVALVKDMQVIIPLAGLIDVPAERARLQKDREKKAQGADGVRRKLDAPNFADKAPADVVQKAREQLAEYEAQIRTIDEQLRDLE